MDLRISSGQDWRGRDGHGRSQRGIHAKVNLPAGTSTDTFVVAVDLKIESSAGLPHTAFRASVFLLRMVYPETGCLNSLLLALHQTARDPA